MKIVNRKQAQIIDHLSSVEYGIPSIELMENAGRESFILIKENVADYKKKNFLVVCGGGNNGGDGAVVARYLHNEGIKVSVCYLFDMQDKTGDKVSNFNRLKDLNVLLKVCQNFEEWDKFFTPSFDVVVDAIFGIGFHGELDPFLQSVITAINRCSLIISLDIPSGLEADSQNFTSTIRATHTITFGVPKLSLVDYPGKERTGCLTIVDIGFPQELMKNINIHLVQKEDVTQRLLKRSLWSHKGVYGHVLIIGGDKAMTGAVKHAGQAAYRAGAGLVTVSVEQGQEALYASFPELMLLSYDSPDQILQFIHSKNIKTILLGCGWGVGASQEKLLNLILKLNIKTLILDADALNILFSNKKLKKSLMHCHSKCILTPHLKEFSRMTGESIENIRKEKISLSKKFSLSYGCTLLLKDSVSLVADSQGEVWFNSTGNDTLAKGGSGDVLAGIVAGLLSSGHGEVDGVMIASYILGYTAELYTKRHSSRSALPQDIIDLLALAFKDME